MAQHIETDVLIIGGGLVGGTLACALAQSGVKAVAVDLDPPATQLEPIYDGRSSAISLSSQRVLETVGIWRYMTEGAAAIDEIRVTDGNSPLFLHYDHKEVGDDPLGWIAENRVMRHGIFQRFTELDDAVLLAPAKLKSYERGPDGVRAEMADGTTVSAALLVGADGRKSRIREDAGIGLAFFDYHQTGIVLTLAHEKPPKNVAQEPFLPSGPFAILPLPGNRSSIVWTEKNHLIPTFMAMDDETFMSELKSRFGDFLGEIEVIGPRFAYPLTIQFADAYIAPRLALVGDAAHGMHPIAGQGMNMGVRDVAALTEILVEAKRLGLDLGSTAVLERYPRWRRFDNWAMLALTDVLNRLFSNDIAPIRIARDIGLAVVNKIPPLRKTLMRHAMGVVGDLPKLMRGEML